MKKIIILIFVFLGFLGFGFTFNLCDGISCQPGETCSELDAACHCGDSLLGPSCSSNEECIDGICKDNKLICTNNGGSIDDTKSYCACNIIEKTVSCSDLGLICSQLGGSRENDLCYVGSQTKDKCIFNQIYDEQIGGVWSKGCCPSVVVASQENPGTKACIINTEGTAGMTMNADCLINGQCTYNIYETLGIRKSDQNPSVETFVQDIVLAVTTFIGTVVAIVLVISGILYIVSGIKGDTSMADKAKKGIFNSVLGLVLVVTSYAIVRLIQFLATAGGG